jgi:hypothetical protein
MTMLRHALSSFEHACAALWRRLDSPRVLATFAIALPVFFGLLAAYLGQDDNWDLHNYHLYNPYALLNGKIGFDLAPGQWQTYFNPALDLVYYGLTRTLPAPLVGFIMGALHGLNAVLVLALARRLVGSVAQPAYRLPLMLALAGCCAPGFLSELGNTMGDNMTSLLVLSSLLLLVAKWERLQRPGALAITLCAGLLIGAGTGLKLTNAIYALSMCLALLSLPAGLWLRINSAFVFGLGTLGGIGASAGWWYWKMWSVFGNPLFPQFNDRFHGLLAAPIGIGDTGWIPKGLTEKLLWPFIITLHPKRTIEVPMTQLIWPMLLLLFAAFVVFKLRAAIRGDKPALASPQRFVLLFFALSYLMWLNMFGIYRYLVPIELLAPLILWLVVHSLMPAAVARGVATYALVLAAVVIFPVSSWGHAQWRRDSFSAAPPVIAQPAQSMVFTVHGDPPMGWLVPFFPKELAFVALGSGFPESEAYAARVASMMAARSGPIYVMLEADRHDPAIERSPEELRAAQERNAGVLERAREVLGRYRISLNADSCTAYPAFSGSNRWTFQLCTVNKPQ